MKLIRHFIRSVTIYRWNGYKALARALRPGAANDSVYLPKGFGNTEAIEHDEGTCLRCTQLDMPALKQVHPRQNLQRYNSRNCRAFYQSAESESAVSKF